jgi:hypothetical protein
MDMHATKSRGSPNQENVCNCFSLHRLDTYRVRKWQQHYSRLDPYRVRKWQQHYRVPYSYVLALNFW